MAEQERTEQATPKKRREARQRRFRFLTEMIHASFRRFGSFQCASRRPALYRVILPEAPARFNGRDVRNWRRFEKLDSIRDDDMRATS